LILPSLTRRSISSRLGCQSLRQLRALLDQPPLPSDALLGFGIAEFWGPVSLDDGIKLVLGLLLIFAHQLKDVEIAGHLKTDISVLSIRLVDELLERCLGVFGILQSVLECLVVG